MGKLLWVVRGTRDPRKDCLSQTLPTGAPIPLPGKSDTCGHTRVPRKVLIPVPEIWESGTKDGLEKTWEAWLLITGNSQPASRASKIYFLAQNPHEAGLSDWEGRREGCALA